MSSISADYNAHDTVARYPYIHGTGSAPNREIQFRRQDLNEPATISASVWTTNTTHYTCISELDLWSIYAEVISTAKKTKAVVSERTSTKLLAELDLASQERLLSALGLGQRVEVTSTSKYDQQFEKIDRLKLLSSKPKGAEYYPEDLLARYTFSSKPEHAPDTEIQFRRQDQSNPGTISAYIWDLDFSLPPSCNVQRSCTHILPPGAINVNLTNPLAKTQVELPLASDPPAEGRNNIGLSQLDDAAQRSFLERFGTEEYSPFRVCKKNSDWKVRLLSDSQFQDHPRIELYLPERV